MHTRGRIFAARCLAVACGLLLALPLTARASAHVEVAELGNISATFTYRESRNKYGIEQASGLKVTISRSGTIVYSAMVSSPMCGTECAPTSQLCGSECAPAFGGSDIHVAILEPGGEPDVVLDLYTGGAHCCFVEQVFQGPGANGVTMAEHDFGNGRGQLEALGPAGRSVLVSVDNRFAYAFTDYADSGLPAQVWAFSGGAFTDVTREYPALISTDAARQWRYFKQRKENDVGFFAAWAADEEMLGHGSLVKHTLARELRTGRLRAARPPVGVKGKRFARELTADLKRWGYTH